MNVASDTTIGEIYVLVQAALWGLFPVVTILLYTSVSPLYAGSICSFLAALFFAVLLTARGKWPEVGKRSAWLDILAASLIIGVVFYALVFLALRYTTAGNVAIIGLMEVFFSFLILSVIVGEEHVTPSHAWGAVLMVIGAAIVLLPQVSALNVGDGIVLFASAIPPVGNMFMKRARKKVSAETIMFVRSLIGSIFLFALAFFFESRPTLHHLRDAFWLLMLNGIVLLAFTKWLWVESVHRISIPKAISLTSISPLITLIVAYYILHETILIQQVMGVIPLLLGMYFLTRQTGRKSTPIVHPVV